MTETTDPDSGFETRFFIVGKVGFQIAEPRFQSGFIAEGIVHEEKDAVGSGTAQLAEVYRTGFGGGFSVDDRDG